MKVFIALLVIASAAVLANASAGYGGSSGGGGYGGGASIPAPPCPKNYLFSCQPSLTPAPCAQPAPAYGSSGAYSETVPTYLNVPVGLGGGYQGLQGPIGYGNVGYGVVQGIPNVQN